MFFRLNISLKNFKEVQAMPSFVITEKCDGCKAQDKTACQYICPNDLMALNRRSHEGLQSGAGAVLGVL